METSRAFAARAASGERASSRDALEDDDAWRANAVEDFERVRREGRASARERRREARERRRDDDDDFFGVARDARADDDDVSGKTCVVRGGWTRGETTGRSSLGRGRGVRAKGTRMERRAEDGRRRAARAEAAARDACAEDAECARVDGASAIERYPPDWMKVFAMKWALENEEYGCDRAVWLDPEATFHVDARETCDDDGTCETTRRSVTEIVEDALGNKDFFYAPESAMTSECRAGRHPRGFDAGVFGVRNSPTGREIVDAWARAYPARAWSLSDDRPSGWRCETFRRKNPGASGHAKECSYEGVEYERGAFISSVLPTYAANATRLDPCVASAPCASRREATARGASFCHFPSCLGERYADGYLASTNASAETDDGALGALARACPPRDVPSAGLPTDAHARSVAKSFFSIDAERALAIVFSASAFLVFVFVFVRRARRRARAQDERAETLDAHASESSPLV